MLKLLDHTYKEKCFTYIVHYGIPVSVFHYGTPVSEFFKVSIYNKHRYGIQSED